MTRNGRCAFITGGGGGFGRAFAAMFLKRGLNVALIDRDEAALAGAVEALGAPGRVWTRTCDATDAAALASTASAARNALGAFDVVCLNAGIVGAIAPTETLTADDWRRTLDVNLVGPAVGASVFVPLLKTQPGGGRIVFTASMAGLLGQPWGAPYSASKAGVVSLAESLAFELRGSDVAVSVLCPGFAQTGLDRSIRSPRGAPAEDSLPQANLKRSIETGLTAEAVAEALARGLDAGDFFIFTHTDMWPWLDRRLKRIERAYRKALV